LITAQKFYKAISYRISLWVKWTKGEVKWTGGVLPVGLKPAIFEWFAQVSL
jgi:hypothetical protein